MSITLRPTKIWSTTFIHGHKKAYKYQSLVQNIKTIAATYCNIKYSFFKLNTKTM